MAKEQLDLTYEQLNTVETDNKRKKVEIGQLRQVEDKFSVLVQRGIVDKDGFFYNSFAGEGNQMAQRQELYQSQ